MSQYTHYHQFDGMNDEIAIVCHFDYEPAEPEVLHPIEDAYPGCAECATISSVHFNINGNLSYVTGLIDEVFMAELEEACLDYYTSTGE